VKREGQESLAAGVRERLRAEIYDGVLWPGTRLLPNELGTRFGVSLSVMREAMGALAAEGLVRIERNRGFHVTALSPEHLADLTFARKVNEGAALRLSLAAGGVAWEADLHAAHHRLASLPPYQTLHDPTHKQEWNRAHAEFHDAMIGAAQNAVLLDICRRLSDAANRYRAWAGREGSPAREVAEEHRALLDAALAHDADLAVALFGAHVERTAAILLEFAGEDYRDATEGALSSASDEEAVRDEVQA
jgi:DNA-binding GntR family transcriptional regulator